MSPAAIKPKIPPAVDIQTDSALWDAQPDAESAIRAAIAAAATASTSGNEVSILLTDDSAVRVLNREWRGIDKATNVLSFPAPEAMAKGAAGILGDIVIAYETVARESADEKREFLHHLTHLTVHGYLHLVGYDHQDDAQANEMESLESKIMTHMQLPDPWQESEKDRTPHQSGA
ncbi:MAG: rRNA maturation RNase YbeY [Pseudolabrys sp.]|nr:rRNA maturation RNase YbeY [Pseudolabrys sp.]